MIRLTMLPALVVLSSLATGCSGGLDDSSAGPGDTDTALAESSRVLLSDTDRLLRIAMTLKGTRPTLEEFERVEANPATLDQDAVHLYPVEQVDPIGR